MESKRLDELGSPVEWGRMSCVSSEKGGKKHWEYWCEVSDVLAVERVWDVWGWAAVVGGVSADTLFNHLAAS